MQTGAADSTDCLQRRVAELDGLRGIAVLAVIVWHYFGAPLFGVGSGPVSRGLTLGLTGVDLFFVLSGFLITSILLENRTSPNLLKVFYLRRLCRIVPAYVLLLCFALVMPWLFGMDFSPWLFDGCMPWWSYLSFTQNIVMSGRGTFGCHALGSTWSLAIEEHFYLVLPALLLLGGARAMVVVAVVSVTLMPLLRLGIDGFSMMVLSPYRVDELFIGALIAYLVRIPGLVTAMKPTVPHVALVTSVQFVWLLTDAIRGRLFSVDFLQIAIFYGAVLFLTLLTVGSPRSRFLRSRTLCYFGRISYGLYLFHVPVLGVVFACGGWTSPTLETVGGYCAAILVSAISFHVIEKPILTFGQSVPYLPNPGAVGLETLGRARKADLDA